MTELSVRIVGRNLPGPNFAGRSGIRVGIQRGKQPVALVAGDADSAVFEVPVRVRQGAGGIDFAGPYVQGRAGERHLLLSWGTVGPGDEFTMVRRAKIHLPVSVGEDGDIAHAAERGDRLEGSLELTDPKGGPVCASVRPPLIAWRLLPGTG